LIKKLTITITKIISITNSNRILNGNQPRDASTSTTAIGIVNKYFADIPTSQSDDGRQASGILA